MNGDYPTLTLGGTVEGQVAVSDRVWLWARADVGWHVIGAVLQGETTYGYSAPVPWRSNVAEGPTAAFTVGARFAL